KLADWREIHPHMFHDFYERHEGVLPDLLETKLKRPTTLVEIDSHEAAQAALLELGNILGFDTYTSDPSKDPGRQFYEVVNAAEYGYAGVIPRNLGHIATLEKIPEGQVKVPASSLTQGAGNHSCCASVCGENPPVTIWSLSLSCLMLSMERTE